MQRIMKKTIGRLIVEILAAAMVVIAVIMIVVLSLFGNVIGNREIDAQLKSEVQQNKRYVRYIDERYQFSHRFSRSSEEKVHLVIIDKDGKALDGIYPEGFPEKATKVLNQRVHKIKNDKNEVFYAYEIKYGKYIRRYGDEIYLRGVISEKDGFALYNNLIYMVCGSFLITTFLVVLCGRRLEKYVSGPLKDIQETAEKIEKGMDMSHRMEYTGNLYELELLVDTENKMLDKMENVFLQQERFSSDVAHELRTPIAVVRAQCEYALEKPRNELELKEAIEVIDRQSRKINGMIGQLLELSRLEQRNYKLEKEELSLVEIVESVCDDVEEEFHKDKKLTMVQELEEAYVCGDIYLITIAIQNLLQNAKKFSEDGKKIYIRINQDKDNVYVSVKDEGKGMTELEKKNVFKRFYKSDESRNSQGFGLGLALTQKIMEVHDGEIRVESQIGIGSEFTLVFPVVKKSGI